MVQSTKTRPMLTGTTMGPTLHQVNFKATRFQEMIDWYAKVVGADVNFRFRAGHGSPTIVPGVYEVET